MKNEISQKLKIDLKEINLSMGMSADYEEAVIEGANYVRVGSNLFGERYYPDKKNWYMN